MVPLGDITFVLAIPYLPLRVGPHAEGPKALQPELAVMEQNFQKYLADGCYDLLGARDRDAQLFRQLLGDFIFSHSFRVTALLF